MRCALSYRHYNSLYFTPPRIQLCLRRWTGVLDVFSFVVALRTAFTLLHPRVITGHSRTLFDSAVNFSSPAGAYRAGVLLPALPSRPVSARLVHALPSLPHALPPAAAAAAVAAAALVLQGRHLFAEFEDRPRELLHQGLDALDALLVEVLLVGAKVVLGVVSAEASSRLLAFL